MRGGAGAVRVRGSPVDPSSIDPAPETGTVSFFSRAGIKRFCDRIAQPRQPSAKRERPGCWW
jgi:hypothetical protein